MRLSALAKKAAQLGVAENRGGTSLSLCIRRFSVPFVWTRAHPPPSNVSTKVRTTTFAGVRERKTGLAFFAVSVSKEGGATHRHDRSFPSCPVSSTASTQTGYIRACCQSCSTKGESQRQKDPTQK